MNIKEHGTIEIPAEHYLELIEVHKAYNDKAILVYEHTRGTFKQFYSISENELLEFQAKQIESLQKENDTLQKENDTLRFNWPTQTPKKSFWKFWA